MALDTAAKRLSVIHLGSPWRGIIPVPDSTVGQADRQTIFFLCGAILAIPLPVPPAPTYATLIMNPRSNATLFSTQTSYANVTVTPGTLDEDVEDPDE
jgi:hypothetical protein